MRAGISNKDSLCATATVQVSPIIHSVSNQTQTRSRTHTSKINNLFFLKNKKINIFSQFIITYLGARAAASHGPHT